MSCWTATMSARGTMRSDRIVVGLQPNNARIMRLIHDSRFSRASPFERRANPGKSRCPALVAAESAVVRALLSAMANKSALGIAGRIGIGDADPRQDIALKPFHPFGLAVDVVIVS